MVLTLDDEVLLFCYKDFFWNNFSLGKSGSHKSSILLPWTDGSILRVVEIFELNTENIGAESRDDKLIVLVLVVRHDCKGVSSVEESGYAYF